MRRRVSARIPVLLLVLFLFASGLGGAGCGAAPPTTGGEFPPVELPSPQEYAGDFFLEQRVAVRHPEGERSFRAVLERRGPRMTMIGLGPAGARGFVLVQEDAEVSFERFAPIELPFPPEYILRDVHRVWRWPLGGAPASDGERAGRDPATGELVWERWAEGTLRERSYADDDGVLARVDYGSGRAPDAPSASAPPEVVVLESRRYRYTLTLTTRTWRALE